MPVPAHTFQDQLVKVIKEVKPSVVSVKTVALIRDFYKVHPVGGMGSGVVIDDEGHLVTSRHVIEKAQRVSIADSKGDQYEAKLLGTDSRVDTALFQIQDGSIPPAKLGDSDKLEVGQLAIAIGSPFGFVLGGPTATTGIVSAVNRQIRTKDILLENLIQTDCAINPGNSGGPLVDIDGCVIAINTATIQFADGIGFAMAINSVKEVVNEIIQHGRVRRPWMGIGGFPVTRQLARTYSLPVDEGVVVAQIVPGGPAYRAGLREGDIIIGLEKQTIKTMEEVGKLIQQHDVGDRLEVTVVRGRGRRDLTIQLGEVPT
jgi:S1-C subfamily serine protease